MKIFLSYASEDRREAESIYYKLVNADHTIFFDRRSLSPGKEFDSEIKREINESDLFIFLISPNSVDASSYTLTELKFAEEKWKHPKNGVLPVMLTATDYNNIPGYLSAVTFFEAHGNMAAEVAAHIEKINEENHKPKYKKQVLMGITVVLLLLVILGIKFLMPPKLDPDGTGANGNDNPVALKKCQNIDSSQDASLDSSELSIFKAAGNGHFARVVECLGYGIDVNLKEGNGWTALHAATATGHLEIAKLLLSQKKININALDKSNGTPLYYAVDSNQYKTVNYLLENGADQTIANLNGVRPFARAKSPEMKKLLEKF